MNFLSICSGIDAASVAFNPLGWKAVGFSEIEPFPCAVLAHHYPDVPNFGDMTKFKEWPEDILAKVDIVVGGPPCQAFSVAGMRGGLDDARGNLTLTYVELIDHVDAIRSVRGLPPVLALYENVPGLLSDKTNAFGCLVGAIAGQSEAIETETGKWPTCGIFWGEKRRVGYRILDAQFFGLAQRRRRVFLLAVPNELVERVGERADPGEILSIPTSLRRDSAPSREARQEVAGSITQRIDRGGVNSEGGDNHIVPSVTHALRAEGFDASEDGTGRGTPLVPHLAPTLDARAGRSGETSFATSGGLVPHIAQCLTTRTGQRYDPETETILPFDTTQITSVANRSSPKEGDPCHPLAAQAHVPAIAFALQHAQIGRKDSAGPQGKGWQEEVAFTQDSRSCADAVAIAFGGDIARTLSARHDSSPCADRAMGVAVAMVNMQGSKGNAVAQADGPSYTLNAMHGHDVHAIAFTAGVDCENNGHEVDEPTGPLMKGSPTGGGKPLPAISLPTMQVRRLTPVECARLQGFPDDYLDITFRKKPAADGPKYKALGNSWAVPVVRWIGERIKAAL